MDFVSVWLLRRLREMWDVVIRKSTLEGTTDPQQQMVSQESEFERRGWNEVKAEKHDGWKVFDQKLNKTFVAPFLFE